MAITTPLRMTCQRQIILEELGKVKSHPTADEVYEMVRRRLPRISLGTVYRNLEVLSQCGMIQKLELGGSQRRYDGQVKRHYHVRCQQCGRMDDIISEPMAEIESKLRSQCPHEIVGHRLELIGVCPDCKTA